MYPRHRSSMSVMVSLMMLASGVVGLSGCTTVGPDFKQPELAVQDKWSTQLTAAASVQAGTPDTFWLGFHDPDLVQLIQKADQHSLTLRSAAEQVTQAKEALRITQGNALPSVALNASRNYAQPDIPSLLKGKNEGATTDQVLGQLSWEIDFWGKQRRAKESDVANVAAAESALDAARVSLHASLATAYCNVRVLEKRVAVAQANLLQQAEDMRIAEARFRLGATSELDLRQAQTQYEQTKAQIPALRSALAQNQHAVSLLLGETPDYFTREIPTGKSLPSLPNNLPTGAPRDLLRRRPDIRQAEFAAAAQSARIGQAEAALYPSFTLGGALGFSTTAGADSLFKWDSRAISYGIGFNFPIFDRGRLRSQVKVQDSIFAQAVLAYQNQVLKAQQEVEDALVSINEGVTQLESLKRGDQAALRSSELALARYRSGQTDYTTVSNAEQARLQTSDAVVLAEGNLLQAYISAYRALGGDWLPIEKEIAGRDLP